MQPYDFAQAREACARASRAQEAAETGLRDSAREFAEKEERYRVALATEIVRQHAEEGVAWTVAPDLARGNVNVARLRRERDIAEGVREAMQQAAWRRAADRKDTQRFVDWSLRREMAEAYGHVPEPTFEPPIGGRSHA
jgi:DNA-binding transcriptional LysR family regulator